MGLLDVKGYDPVLIEDPVHYGEAYITSKIFNSGADMPTNSYTVSCSDPALIEDTTFVCMIQTQDG